MQLLVSVRSEAEAEIVSRYPIDRLDLKEPRLGSLGPTSADVWQNVVLRWHQQFDVSIALGELLDNPDLAGLPHQADSIKVGLAGCSGLPDWPERLRLLYHAAPETVSRVAVYYADQQSAGCPSFDELMEVAEELGCATVLVDTFTKSKGSVFVHRSEQQLIEMRNRVQRQGCQFALAGSIQHDDLPSVKNIRPDILAVRSAICQRDRTGQICQQRISAWMASLQASRALSTRGSMRFVPLELHQDNKARP